MSEQKELDLFLEPDAPEVDLLQQPQEELPVAQASPKELPIEVGISELREQLDREKAARIAAENHAREIAEHANRANTDAHDTNIHLVASAIDELKRQQNILRQQKVEAMAVGDYDKVAEIDEVVFESKTNLRELESYKNKLETTPKPRVDGPPMDPVEQIASQLSRQSADWVRAHPEYVTDQRLFRKMTRAHEEAMDEGYKADTPEYFDYVENRLGLRGDDGDAMSEASAPTQRRSAPSAAPTSRTAGSSSTSRNAIRLTAAQKEAAEISGMTEAEYMEQVRRGQETRH
jgi:hypothetical protein